MPTSGATTDPARPPAAPPAQPVPCIDEMAQPTATCPRMLPTTLFGEALTSPMPGLNVPSTLAATAPMSLAAALANARPKLPPLMAVVTPALMPMLNVSAANCSPIVPVEAAACVRPLPTFLAPDNAARLRSDATEFRLSTVPSVPSALSVIPCVMPAVSADVAPALTSAPKLKPMPLLACCMALVVIELTAAWAMA